MSKRSVTAVIVFLLATVGVLAATSLARGQSFDNTLHVNADAGSNDNPGTEAEPLRTIQEAMDRATENKNEGQSTHVRIASGVYREAVEFAFSNYDGGGTNAPVLVEGAGPEETVIKGSEVFEGWQSVGGGVFSHEWTKDWGVADDPTGGYIKNCDAHPNFCADTPELVLRREMVFVNGERMRQVLSSGAMEPGTFRVDENADKLYLHPPAGADLSEAFVEVALRSKGWMTRAENNFTLRSLRVEHVATPWAYGGAAVVLSGDDNSIENVSIVQNNYNGLRPRGENVSLQNFTLNRNGASGLAPFKIIDFLAEDGQVNRNNWRGALGGYTGWSVGNKFFKGHSVAVRDVAFNNNQSRGLWLDTDLKNVLLEDVEVRGNLRDNIWVERTQGPVTLRRVVSTGSDGFGIALVNAMNTVIEDSHLFDNQKGGIHISGDEGGVEIGNFETGESMIVKTRHLTLAGSVISGVEGPVQAGGGDSARYLIGTTFWSTWNDFIDTYEADNNTWYEAEQPTAFEWSGNELISFEKWQDRTGQDQNSVFGKPWDSILLQEGWNIISSPVQPRDSSLSEVFAEMGNGVALVKNEAGERFIPDGSKNTIGEWHSRKAYMVYMTEADTLRLEGRRLPFTSTSLSLHEGWNLVPYFGESQMPVEDALSPLSSTLVIVKDNRGRVYQPSRGINKIENFQPGRGYKVYVSEQTTFTYPPESP